MKTPRLTLSLLLAALVPQFANADLVGPYTPDANTLVLLHFSESSGSATVNSGTLGHYFYSVNYASASATPPLVTGVLGATGFSAPPTNFGNCENISTAGYELGYDYNGNGQYDADSGSGTSVDFMPMSRLNIGNGGQTPFTLEALIQPTTTAGNQEIICTDSDAGSRGFQFRITAGALQFQFISGSQAVSGTIPTTGSDAFVAGNWYHVAVVYNGSTATLYWTALNPGLGAAHVLGTPTSLTLGTAAGAVTGPLVVGNRGRPSGTETFFGSIDEVRISNVARAANQMQFYSPLVTISANPISQNVDYNQPVTLSVSATSQYPLGYQWRFNSNSIAGATNTSYVITNVAAGNSGYYDCYVTNTIGHSATSTEAQLIVGAANFIANRYSFLTSSIDPDTGLLTTPDSIGGQTGTNFGDATITGGQLVLSGNAGSYMQLPANLFNSANATALTVEFWASFGSNPNNVYAFSFGYTNYVFASGIVGVNYVTYSPHNSGGQTLASSPSDPTFAQNIAATGNWDGQTVHVACVIDPPDKTLAIYTNGVLEAINTNFTVNIANINDQLSYIGASLWAADPYLMANFSELRIFRGALSSISIKQSNDQGYGTLLSDGPATFVIQPVSAPTPLGQTATFTAATVGYLPITYQWFKNGTLIPGATNASYSYIPTTADNNASFVVKASNTIGVTTYVTNSAAATLTVFVPPTLAWLDSAHGGADSSWNTTSYDWADSGNNIVTFVQTNGALFDSRGSGSPSVDIAGAIAPYSITVNAASGSDYLLYSPENTGALIGQGSLIKQNSDTLTIDLTNNLTGPVTISGGTLQVGNYDNFGTLGSGPVTNNATLVFNRSDAALTVLNSIHGSGTVNFNGSGTVSINGNSDYSGATFVNSGIVDLNSSAGFGAAGSGTTVANGAQVYITGNVDVAEPFTLNSSGDGNGALRKGGAGATTANGAITLASDSYIGVDSGATLTLSNVVSGASALTAVGSGTLALSANNTYSGGLTLNGPVVNLNAAKALGTAMATVGGNGRFVIGDGLTITNPILASTVSPGTATGLLMVNDNTNGTVTTLSGWLEFDNSPATGNDFQGPLTSGYLTVTGPITNAFTGVVGSRNGFVRFSGGGNYTLFNLNQGTASIGANNGLCTNAVLSIGASAAATFDLNGYNQALAGLIDAAANPEFVTNSASTLSTLTLNLTGENNFSGVIGGNVALVENGSSDLYLSGASTYTGNTTINGGILELVQPILSSRSTITVASGGSLLLDFTGTNVVRGLVLGGVNQPLGFYNNTTTPAYFNGPGSLFVQPIATNPVPIVTSLTHHILTMSWPADHTGWRLLQQTNHLAQGLSLNTNDWAEVSGSEFTNKEVLTVSPTNRMEFFRMAYP